MKKFTTILTACLIGTCGGYVSAGYSNTQTANFNARTVEHLPNGAQMSPAAGRTVSGDYLASLFAQRHHDWDRAGEYLEGLMLLTPDEPSLTKRAMVLAMGAGDVEKALLLAQRANTDQENASLAQLFRTVGAFHDKNYELAKQHIADMPEGSLSGFLMPLLSSWADAGNGILNVSGLSENTIHIHHAALIADFVNKPADIESMLEKITAGNNDLAPEDLERAANLYAHINKPDKAGILYQDILNQWPGDRSVSNKLAVLKSGKKLETIAKVRSPEEGIAAALYDMANLLYRERADDSARVFAQMALYLMPALTDSHLLLAAIDARNDRLADAIRSYRMIGPESKYYTEARHRAADLLEKSDDFHGALSELNDLSRNKNDMDALIKMGDLYRRQNDFTNAIEVYNRAAQKLGGNIPKDYWNLLYARGMTYEQAGDWLKAEADLKAALSYQPDNPFVLNYLGYAWADRQLYLPQALDYIRKAAASRPDDGYIIDSLGWVLYRMGQYNDALPKLEKAVELLPHDALVNDHLGDAYWQSGRKREARFQWQRAANFSKDPGMVIKITKKLQEGLPKQVAVKEAHSQTQEMTTTH